MTKQRETEKYGTGRERYGSAGRGGGEESKVDSATHGRARLSGKAGQRRQGTDEQERAVQINVS